MFQIDLKFPSIEIHPHIERPVRELVTDEHHLGCLAGYPRDDIPDALTATGLDMRAWRAWNFGSLIP
jgi:hypothetical protein